MIVWCSMVLPALETYFEKPKKKRRETGEEIGGYRINWRIRYYKVPPQVNNYELAPTDGATIVFCPGLLGDGPFKLPWIAA